MRKNKLKNNIKMELYLHISSIFYCLCLGNRRI